MSVEVVFAQKHIMPERSELLLGQTIKCSEPDCVSTFKSQSNLTLHLLKIHKKNVSLSFRRELNQVYFYYCPEPHCIYNRDKNLEENKNYFTELKHLKQHFRKVHKEKEFQCLSCKKAFPDEFSLKRHVKVCGQKFYCGVCGSSYKNQTSLVYHVKQKSHTFEMTDFDRLMALYGADEDDVCVTGTKNKKKSRAKTHQAIQTDQAKTKKRPAITQTTQTLACTNKKPKGVVNDVDVTCQKVEVVASTQTLPIDLNYIFDDPLLTYADNSSQTGHDLTSSHFHMETQTELNSSVVNNFPLEMDNSCDNDPLLFNHMHTQTTDELLEDACFDIHTQTHFDTEFDYSDYQELVSTETQTYIPRSSLYANNSSSYTQTSQSIEALNQIDTTFTSSHTQTWYWLKSEQETTLMMTMPQEPKQIINPLVDDCSDFNFVYDNEEFRHSFDHSDNF